MVIKKKEKYGLKLNATNSVTQVLKRKGNDITETSTAEAVNNARVASCLLLAWAICILAIIGFDHIIYDHMLFGLLK